MEALTRVRQRSLGQPPDGGAAGTEGRTSRTWASMFLAVCVKRVPKASSTNAADMPSVEAGEAGRRQERGLRSLAKITEVMGVHQRRRSSLHEIDSMAFWETKRFKFAQSAPEITSFAFALARNGLVPAHACAPTRHAPAGKRPIRLLESAEEALSSRRAAQPRLGA